MKPLVILRYRYLIFCFQCKLERLCGTSKHCSILTKFCAITSFRHSKKTERWSQQNSKKNFRGHPNDHCSTFGLDVGLNPTPSIAFIILRVVRPRSRFNHIFSGYINMYFGLIVINSKNIRLIAKHADSVIGCSLSYNKLYRYELFTVIFCI